MCLTLVEESLKQLSGWNLHAKMNVENATGYLQADFSCLRGKIKYLACRYFCGKQIFFFGDGEDCHSHACLAVLECDADEIAVRQREIDRDRQRLGKGVLHERVFLEKLDELFML